MNTLAKRIITGFAIFFALVFIISLKSKCIMDSIIFAVCLVSFLEFIKISNIENKIESALLSFPSVIFPILFPYNKLSFSCFLFFSLIFLLTTIFFCNKNNLEAVKKNVFLSLLFFILISIGEFSLVSITALDNFKGIFYWLILVVPINDICAYIGGSTFKGKKFNEAISPNKTMSGSICGILGAFIMSLFTHKIFGLNFGAFGFFFATLLVAWCSQMGDLIESLIKRTVGVKDSSNIIPGHGGMLDRVDAFMGASFIAYLVFCI